MSTAAKGTSLRLVIPKDSTGKILATLGPSTKIESRDMVLSAGRMTTGQIFSSIKECARLRDDLLHTIRQLGLVREPRVATSEAGDYANALAEARNELDEKKERYQDLQSKIENLEREIEEVKKQSSRISEVIHAGFASGDVAFTKGEFNRILGRIPTRKLADAQRSLENMLKGQVVLAAGNKIKDWVYILVAAPEEKSSQALQTLLLYDFIQTDVPKSDEPDLKASQASLEAKAKELTEELNASREEMKLFQKEAGEALNRLADDIQDSLMQLQAVLRMGEGSNASQAFAWLSKTPNQKMLNALSSLGVLFETE